MSLFAELKRRNVIRVAVGYLVLSWLVLQVGDVLIQSLELSSDYSKFIVILLALGAIPALVFSWIYEMTPDGIKKESEITPDQSVTAHTAKKLDVAVIVLLVAAMGMFAADRFLGDRGQAAAPTSAETTEASEPIEAEAAGPDLASVAVLPFVNMSADADNEYFSDGLTETLLHMLAQTPELQVAARTSSFAFKGTDIDIREIANTLGVAHILEGSVQRAGDRVRITAQLIRAEDGFHVWSDIYDRTLDDIFGIQDEIAGKVANSLLRSLIETGVAVQVESIGTQNLEAYDLYLQALAQNAIRNYGSYTAAEGLFKSAIALDPDFHDAKLGLAQNYLEQASTGQITTQDAMRLASPLVSEVRAERPDDLAAEGLALILEAQGIGLGGDFEGFVPLIDKLGDVYERDASNEYVRNSLVSFLEAVGRGEEALAILLAAYDLDPLAPAIHNELGNLYRGMGRLDEAEAIYLRWLELTPDHSFPYWSLARLAQRRGDAAGMIEWWLRNRQVDRDDHEIPTVLALSLYGLGMPDEASVWAARAEAMAPDAAVVRSIPLHRAFYAGDEDARFQIARELLETDVEDRWATWTDALIAFIDGSLRRSDEVAATAFLEARYPSLTDLNQPSSSIDILFARPHVLELLVDQPDLAASIDQVVADLDDTGISWRGVRDDARILALRGEVEASGEKVLEWLEGETVHGKRWRLELSRSLFADVIEVPAVRARLDELDQQEAAIREAILAVLAENEDVR
jgi:TolB-like protein/tetratricopeptide (TPR) repeat protein